MTRLGMGGILAVGAGSIGSPPRMIVLEFNGVRKSSGKRGGTKGAASDSQRPLLVVGKAITFDTGGISIKPAEKMGKMIFDKCGGMTVLGVMAALARLRLPVHVVGILSSAENTLSSKSLPAWRHPSHVQRRHRRSDQHRCRRPTGPRRCTCLGNRNLPSGRVR